MTRTLALLSALSVLAACGGGGSGGSPNTAGQSDRTEPAAPSAMAAFSANWDESRRAAIAAATTRAATGGLTQSSNASSGVTRDMASASVADGDVRLTVRRQDGSSLMLDSASDSHGHTDLSSPLPGHSARSYALQDHTATSISAAGLSVTWSNTDPSDYLAGGYWMHFGGTVEPLSVTSAEFGAFVDGPELSGPAALPALGTASYAGRAGGLYAVHYGPNFMNPAPGSRETGEFQGNITLTADFGAETVSGCVGCDGSIMTDHTLVDGTTGQSREVLDEGSDIRFHLGPVSIGASGRFEGATVRVSHPHPDLTFVRTEGSWAGRFSNRQDNGAPRLAAGTFGGRAESSGNTEIVFVGAWYATK